MGRRSNVRNSGSWSTATTNAARVPRRLTSTPQSVHPAMTVASGRSASSATAAARSAGRTNSVSPTRTRVAGAAGAGAAQRWANVSSAGGTSSA